MPSDGQQGAAPAADPAPALTDDAPTPLPDDPADASDGSGGAPRVQRLGRLGTAARTWRLVVAGAALVVLIVAQVVPASWKDTNDWFPLGSLSQYAFAGDPDGTVKSAQVVGTTAAGDEVTVWLDQMGVGVGHAEIEAQLGRIVADPSLLTGIARAYAWRYPHRDPFVELRLQQTTTQLRDGRPTGEPTVAVLATFHVPTDGGDR